MSTRSNIYETYSELATKVEKVRCATKESMHKSLRENYKVIISGQDTTPGNVAIAVSVEGFPKHKSKHQPPELGNQ